MTIGRERSILFAIIALAIALHAPSLRAGFTYDDVHTIVRHPGVQGTFSLSDIFLRDWFGHRFGDAAAVGTHRPIVTLTFFVDAHLAGGAPWPFHLTNVLLYGALLFACDAFLRRRDLRGTTRLFAIAAFAALAIHGDVVPSATGRAEILAMLFSIVALTVESPIAIALALLCAMFSKESALPIAVLVPIVAWHRRNPRWVAVAASSATALAVVVAFRARYLPFRVGEEWYLHNPLLVATRAARYRGAAEVLTHYLTHTATGVDLCPDYSYAAIVPEPQFGVRAAIGLLLGVALLLGLVRTFRRNTLAFETLLGFGATYVVVSHLLVPASAIVADRWFFFPSFFLLVLVAIGAESLATARPRIAPVVVGAAGVLTAAQAALAVSVVVAWRDNLTLSARAVRTCPTAIGNRLLRASATASAGQLEEAAWAALVAAVIHARYPRPIDEDALPGAWEDRPIAERRQLLERSLGNARAFYLARESARAAMRAQGMDAVDATLATW